MRYPMPVLVVLSALLLVGCAGQKAMRSTPPLWPDYAFEKRGTFRPTFYQIVNEADPNYLDEPPSVPLRDLMGNEIARVSEKFKRKIDLEGSGKLVDGRVVNHAGRADDDIRYLVADKAPYGLGTGNYKLIPYHTIAVDPSSILLGSTLFIPQAYGLRLPNGEIHDGFFFAHDIGGSIKGDRIDLFVGFEDDVKNAFTRHGWFTNLEPVEVYTVRHPVATAAHRSYREAFHWQPDKQLNEMVSAEIDVLLRHITASQMEVNARIAYFSEKGKGTPYVLFCLGEGPQAKYDRDPLIDFSRADCMTFCEQILALSISRDYPEMFSNLQRIRYREGIIDMLTRNHYTIADWLPANSWLLTDATAAIGGERCAEMTKTIDRAADFRAMGVPEGDLTKVPPPQTMTVKYIPAKYLSEVKASLRGGEIVSIVTNKPGIFSAHMGFIIRDQYGNVLLRHASSQRAAMQVVDEFYDDVVQQLMNSDSRVGMIFMRVREDYRLPEVSRSKPDVEIGTH